MVIAPGSMGRHNDKNIKEVLADYMQSNDRVSRGYYSSRMEEIWQTNMGNVIAGYTKKVTFYNGVLKVYLTSSPLKKELLMGRDKIIDIMNEAIGDQIVKEVEIY
jgi:predicted nucleic acid-binding Zn ribbon protein